MNRQTNGHSAILDELFEAILSLENLDECYDFFGDLFTMQEMTTFAQRLQVAKMLQAGASYTTITKATGASTATISRVSKCSEYGTGGYQTVIQRLEQEDKA